MNGACHAPASSRTCGTVGGALSQPRNCRSPAYGASTGAAIAAAISTPSSVNPNVRIVLPLTRGSGLVARNLQPLTSNLYLFLLPRIDERERGVRQQRADGEEHRTCRGAAGDEVHV